MTPPPYDAVVLAGGEARRMAGRDKVLLDVGGGPLLAGVLDAVADACRHIVVGPERPLPGAVTWTREEPPGGGPAAGLAAGLARVHEDWVAVLAGDLALMRAAHVAVLRDLATRADGAVLVDDAGREQWLAGVWRTAALRGSALGPGVSLRSVLGPLEPYRVTVGDAAWLDVDTPADLARARGLA